MANYKELRKEFNNNKHLINKVLNDQKCQVRLKSEGLSLLNNLIDETTKKVNTLPKVDTCEYSYIFFNNKKLNKTLSNLKKWGLINIHNRKGGYTGITYRYLTLNLNKFKNFYERTQKYFHCKVSLA